MALQLDWKSTDVAAIVSIYTLPYPTYRDTAIFSAQYTISYYFQYRPLLIWQWVIIIIYTAMQMARDEE